MNVHAAEMTELATRLWGQPSARHSTRDELRFGRHGSKAVRPKDGTWYDHEAGEGGSYATLYERVHGHRPTEASIVATYDYRDADGTLLYQVVRKAPKAFIQRRPDGAGGWDWHTKGVRRVPYRLPELLAASPSEPVFVVEGEKDVEALRERLLVATCNAGGAGKWTSNLAEYLRGRRVVIVPDNDQAGEAHALQVERSLRGIAADIRVLRLDHLPPKGDASDWLAAGGTGEQLLAMAETAFSAPAASAEPSSPAPAAAQADAPNGPKLRLVNPVTLATVVIPRREWIVEDWLPIGCVTANYGDGGLGKTLLAQQLMTSTAIGAPWCGREVQTCRSFGLFCEDDEAELHRRQASINLALGCGFEDLEAMRWVSGVGRDNTLMAFEHDRERVTPLLDAIRSAAVEHGARLIVLDTAADLFGGNENDRHQVRRFIGELNRLAIDLNAAVLLNAHPSRSGLTTGSLDGGSTAWNNSVRSRWSIARPQAEDGAEPDADARVLTRRKANYAAVGEEIRLRWVNGVLVPENAVSNLPPGTRAAAEELFLTLLDRCMEQEQSVSESRNAGNYAPKIFAQRPDRSGYARRDFEAAMATLFAAKRIRVAEYGRPGKWRNRIERDHRSEGEST